MSITEKSYSAVTLRDTITVYTIRGRINVIIPGTGPEGEGNHIFTRHGGPIAPQIAACVEAAVKWETDVAKIRSDCRYTGSATWGRGPDGYGLHSEWLRWVAGTPRPVIGERGRWEVRVWDAVPCADGEFGYTL